jgi:hypothetical protein
VWGRAGGPAADPDGRRLPTPKRGGAPRGRLPVARLQYCRAPGLESGGLSRGKTRTRYGLLLACCAIQPLLLVLSPSVRL